MIFKPTIPSLDDNHQLKPKGNVDAELVLHSMIQYPNYEKAIIVSGDGDFHCLVEYLQKQGKLAHVFIPNPKKYSALLRKFRKYFVYIHALDHKLSKRRKTKEGE